jgi:hypothetical protein
MLVFPNGTFSSWVYRNTWERYIEPFVENTSIKILSKHRIDFEWLIRLQDLVQDIYNKKSVSDGGIKLCCKLLLNSLYGRIGLRGQSEKVRLLSYAPDGDDITVFKLRRGQYLVFETVIHEPRSNFPFAAFVTDNARGRLYQSFKQNSAIYGDTDSVFTPRKRFVGKIGNALGEWNNEGRSWFQAHNVKDYEHGCYACAGKGCGQCRHTGIISVRKGGEDFVVWTLKRFASGNFATGVHRTRQSGLRKRTVLANGNTDPLTTNT